MKDLFNEIRKDINRFVELRHQLHENPEIGFEEVNTSRLVSKLLKEWGYNVSEGLAKTGVVATLKCGNSNKVLGIRADMDALPMEENSGKAWCSKIANRFHGCGHDGHTAILLCAAKYLAETRAFNGTLHLIFQPAEELLYGGRVMLEDGLFEKFPCDAIFALHNMPGFKTGHLIFKEGAMMASSDTIHIEVKGKGAHGAMPEMGVDATLVACYIATALQSIVSRNVSPLRPAVITIGSIKAGDAPNIINERALMKLTVRCMDNKTRELVLQRIVEIAEMQAKSFNASVVVDHVNASPVLVNGEGATRYARNLAIEMFGKDKVHTLQEGTMGSEDFAFMLEANPNGCYFMIGGGDEPEIAAPHNPAYDFNDEIIPVGAAFWVKLTESYLK